MMNNLLNLQISDHAQIQHKTMSYDDRRSVDAWFDHLRNWRNDELLRSKARRLQTDEEMYVLETSAGILIAFQIKDKELLIVSLFYKDAMSSFKAVAEQSAS